ncbi:TPA: hypothetical protein I8303_003511 [Aeromonas hydrophila]|uniref:hypothetical protein n=1 Tax=Aeromonas TaxID=642 RepID=UPI001A22C3C1|nr:hypothetical protein [Aeromonas caviae]HAT2714730.1 hypothetical protein [Aeromonas hydrophila]
MNALSINKRVVCAGIFFVLSMTMLILIHYRVDLFAPTEQSYFIPFFPLFLYVMFAPLLPLISVIIVLGRLPSKVLAWFFKLMYSSLILYFALSSLLYFNDIYLAGIQLMSQVAEKYQSGAEDMVTEYLMATVKLADKRVIMFASLVAGAALYNLFHVFGMFNACLKEFLSIKKSVIA